MHIRLILCLALLVLWPACEKSGSSGGAPEVNDASAVDAADAFAADAVEDSTTASTTYHGHARTILEQRCVNCHTQGGGAPFTMDWLAEEWESGPAWWTSMALNAIDDGRMPPWQPTLDCVPIKHSRALLEDELATLHAWQAEGFALGEISEYEPPATDPEVALPDPTITTTPSAPYTPDITQPDDYRCFIMDATFETDRFTTRTDVWPGSKDVVHHVILYQVSSSNVAQLEALDEGAQGLGYPCYGGPGVEGNLIGGWVPGANAFEFPPGSALKIEKGSRIVMQLHYNTIYLDPEKEAPSDLTEMAIWLLPEGETPQDLAFFASFSNHDIFIPANESSSVHVRDEYMGWNGYVAGVVPHMHQIGTEIRGSLVTENDASSCLYDIPKWDFNWQQLYRFEESSEQFVHGLTRHRLTCIYDNSPENQPVINGEQGNPKNVTWGDGSFDEMCITFILLKYPFAATQHSCGNFDWCNERCEADIACTLGCAIGSSPTCTDCISDGYIACGKEHCQAETTAALQCTGPCTDTGTKIEDCIMSDCREPWQTAHECVEPLMNDGTCASHFETCDFGE
jgi:mono/diheme cytochrome c family protein